MISRERQRSLGIWVLAALILDVAGAQHVYAQPSIAAAALAGLGILWLWPGVTARLHENSVQRLLALLPVIALIAAMVDVVTFEPPNSGWTPARLTLLFGGITALLVLNRAPASWIALTALVLGAAIRAIHMRQIPIEPVNGDMLPLVRGALEHLLAGRSPYMTYRMPWEVPLTYLPVTWLSYAPAYLSGIDLRWTNVGAEIVIGATLAWLSARRGARAWHNDPVLILWAWLFLQPTVIHWDTGNTAPITWALLAVLVALVIAGRSKAAAVALGLTAAGTPLVAVFGPFVGLHWLRRYGFVQTMRLLVIAGVVVAVIIGPFLIWAPADFVQGTYRWFNSIEGWPRQKWLETDPPIWSIITGFSGEFWARGAERWLKPIQGLIVLGVAGLYWRRGALAEALSKHAAAAYLGFMLFNPVLWPYLYNPALVVGLVGLVAVRSPQPAIETRVVAPADKRSPAPLT